MGQFHAWNRKMSNSDEFTTVMLIQVQLNSAVPSEFCEYKSFDNLLNYWVNTVNKKTVRSVASVPTADAGPGPTGAEPSSRAALPAVTAADLCERTHPAMWLRQERVLRDLAGGQTSGSCAVPSGPWGTVTGRRQNWCTGPETTLLCMLIIL